MQLDCSEITFQPENENIVEKLTHLKNDIYPDLSEFSRNKSPMHYYHAQFEQC